MDTQNIKKNNELRYKRETGITNSGEKRAVSAGKYLTGRYLRRCLPAAAATLTTLILTTMLASGVVLGATQDPLGQEMTEELAAAIQSMQEEAAMLERNESLAQRFQSLGATIQATGSVAVIVRVRATYRPEGELKGPMQVRAQRYLISTAQETLLQGLVGFDPISIKQFRYIPYLAVIIDPSGLEYLSNSYNVLDIQEDKTVESSLTESVPLIGAKRAWDSGYTGAGQTVAVLDTGIDKSHPFLAGKVVSEACFSTNASTIAVSSLCPDGVAASTAANSALPCDIAGANCDHGTHVAGIIAGKGAEFSGVAKEAKLISMQVYSRLDSSTACSGGRSSCVVSFDSDQINALERVYELRENYQIAAVNLSLGAGRYATNCDNEFRGMKAIIDLLRSVGIATIVASGNRYQSDAISAPACISTAVSVGATKGGTSQIDQVSPFTNNAQNLNLLAPGEFIVSSLPGGRFGIKSGTSMAAPHVAGAWAIARQKSPTASVDEVLGALTTTGVGIIDQRNLLRKPRIRIDSALDQLVKLDIPSPLPEAPSGLEAKALSTTMVRLNWIDNATNETGFKVKRKFGSGGTWEMIAILGPNSTAYEDTRLLAGQNYVYCVKAFNAIGDSRDSNEATVRTLSGLPAAPGALTATTASKTQINLKWNDNSINETGFSIKRRTDPSSPWTEIGRVAVGLTSYIDIGLTPGTTYYYSVAAYNALGESQYSNEVSAKTQSLSPGPNPPNAPTMVMATALPTKFTPKIIGMTWKSNAANADGYIIRRKMEGDKEWKVVTTVGPTTFELVNVGLERNCTYIYCISAYNLYGESTPSQELWVTTPLYNFSALNNLQTMSSTLTRGQNMYYRIYVPPGATQLTVSIAGTGRARGDVDLYLRRDRQPTTDLFDCYSGSIGSNERCFISNPPPGDWHVLVTGHAMFDSSYNILGVWQDGSGSAAISKAPTVETEKGGIPAAAPDRDRRD